MPICIPQKNIEQVADIIASESNSAARRKKLSKLFGEEKAKEINLMYENKLLLKKQDLAMDRVISELDGTSAIKKADLKKKYVENKLRKEKAVDRLELDAITKDIYDRKHNIDLDDETVRAIGKLKGEANELKAATEGTASRSKEKMAYARKLLDIQDVTDSVVDKTSDMKFWKTIGSGIGDRGKRIADEKGALKIVRGTTEALDMATDPAMKTLKAAWDASYLARQGRKVAREDINAFLKANKEANKMWKNLGSKEKMEQAFREWKVGIMSDDAYDDAVRFGLALSNIEEEFTNSVVEKAGFGIGNVFSGSDKSFTTFIQTARLEMYKKFLSVEKAKLGGKMPTDKWMKEMTEMVNSFSGKGKWSARSSGGKTLNRIFFSANYVKSQVDTFYKPLKLGLEPSIRKKYIKNSAKTFAEIGGLMATAALVTEVGMDVRASNFGKAKVPGSKNTWVDLTGGTGSYMTLLARAILGAAGKKAITSVNTGKSYKLNTGEYQSKTVLDIAVQFGYNKLAPGARAFADTLLKGQNFGGKKPTLGNTLPGLIQPITVETGYELWQDEDFLTFLIGFGAEISGLGSTTYKKR